MAQILRPELRHVCIATTLVAVVILSTNLGLAQVTSGSIRGLVSDQTGGMIPGVEIRAINLQTNERFSTISTEAGNYVLVNVSIGNYRVEAELPGFKRLARQPVNVSIGITTNLNLELEVGEVADQVTVEGSVTPLIQADSADVSTTLEQRLVIDLPLELGAATQVAGSGRRQVESFIYLTPGITGTGWNKHFLGSPQHTTQAIIDGIPFALQESPGLSERTPPPYEAVEEFTVTTTMYPANLGRGFGITNYSLRSGTNDFHGNVFWIVRNDATDARGFFATDKPVIRQNEFGFTFGGPIIKDKTFFFGAYDGFRRRGGAPTRGLVTIPSQAFRQGDFSALRTPTGELIPIFDPLTTRPDGEGGFVRDPFPNNMIPASRISPFSKFYMDRLPAPDNPNIRDNFVNRGSRPVDDDSYSVKVNHSFNDNHRVSFTHWWALLPEIRNGALGGHELDRAYATDFEGTFYRANWDWVVSPTLLNHFGWGYQYYPKDNYGLKGGLTNADVGIPGIPPDAFGLPSMRIPGYAPLGHSDLSPEGTTDGTNVITDTLSWTEGRHQVRFGGEYWNSQFSRRDRRGEGGIMNFNQLSTSQPNSPDFGRWGDSLASMLLGEVYSGTLLVSGIERHTWDTNYLAIFLDDKIALTPKLTLTLGLRYDYPTPIAIREDSYAIVDLNLANPAAGGLPGAYRFGRDADGLLQSKNEWAPRLALAYALDDKTVLRAGYGIIYAQSNAQTNAPEIFGNRFQTGFSAISSPVSIDQGITPAFRFHEGFPPFLGELPMTDPGIQVGGVGDWINPLAGSSAYTSNWNLSVQRELPWNLVLDLTVVGVKGTRLPANTESVNQVPAQYLSLGSTLLAPIDSQAAQDAGIGRPYPGFQGSVAQALRPYPQYTTLYTAWNANGNHTYNALLAKVQRRFSNGLGILVSYTLSKNISDTNGNAWTFINPGGMDTARRHLEKSISPIDNTHNLVTNWIYELPVAEGLGGAAGKLVNGWQIGLTTTYVSGPPIAIGGGPPLALFGGANRPNRVQSVSKRTGVSAGSFDPGRDLYLNVDAFSQPAPFSFGNVGRVEGDLRGFSSFGENLSILKRTFVPSLGEEFNVEFRAEFFNLLNRTVFTSPASNINSATTFGRVFGQANQPRHIQFQLKVNF